jgi:hypothetical protein
MKKLQFQIVDPLGFIVEDKIIDFYAGEGNTLLITIGDYTYHLKNDGSLVASENKLFTPYD